MLDRRSLLKLGALGAGAVAANTACAPENSPPSPTSTDQAEANPALAPFELEEKTVAELQAGMESGQWTSRQITELYLERIEALDANGPKVNSILETNPDAITIADGVDKERAAGLVRGPLHGIPVVLKDNIDTADRMQTTAGSLALAGTFAPKDSFLVSRLREAGAVILAKTNLSEWANFRSERSSSGWSGRGGQTRNPYALDRNPCGSSSGTGAAVSANFSAIGVGTETNGSVVCPSNANGLVGIKPTLGLVSRSGIIPLAHSQDTAGPMARCVADAAALLSIMAGVDPADHATAASNGKRRADYTAFLDPQGLQGARIGIWRDRFGFHERVEQVLEESLEAMRSAGAILVDPIELPSLDELGDASYQVLLYEFKSDIAAYLASRSEDTEVKTLEDLIAFNEANRDREMPFFEQEIFLKAQEKGPLTDTAYLEAREKCLRLTRTEGLDRVLAEHKLDAIVGPTGGPAWKTDLVNGDSFGGGSSTPAAVSGYANITVPAGFIHGLPVGLSFMGPAWSEHTLIRLTYAFEQATNIRQPPRFLPCIEGEMT